MWRRSPVSFTWLVTIHDVPEQVVTAILSHNTEGTGVERSRPIDFALLACDEITGLIIATALVLGSKFNLTEISLMWLKQKSVSALSEFLSDAKFSTDEMQHLYLLRTMHLYNITSGYFIVDDTMLHHSKFCKWIHGVSFLFDHALGATLKTRCVVFLYFNDGKGQKFFIDFRIFYQEDSKMPWYRKGKSVHKKKYELAM